MAWSQKVKDEVLIKCGRHCCICHKFCGTKMELHHIILKSELNDDSADNCIPLCFDCHADQKSEDFKHPKGTKYSTNELKGHREKWYNLATQNLGTGTLDHLEQDKHLYLSFYRKMPPNPTIWYLRNLDFNIKKFDLNKLSSMSILINENILEPWMYFFDSDLHAKFTELISIMTSFEETIQNETSPYGDGSYDFQCVPRELEKEEPKRYRETVMKLNKLGDEIVSTYSDFLSLGRKKLGVILPPE